MNYLSFSELSDSFLAEKKVRLRGTTCTGYELIIRRFLNPAFGSRNIYEIKPLDVRKWQNLMLASGYSEYYLHRIHILLSAIFNYAVCFYDLTRNPVTAAGPMVTHRSRDINFWTLAEYKQFIAAVESPLFHLAFQTLYWTGLRVGELLALTPADIAEDSGSHYIHVTRSLKRYHQEDIITPPKTPKSKRIVYINVSLYNELQTYISSQGISSDSRLFLFTVAGLHYQLKTCCARSGVKVIRVHDLRHSHASLLIEKNYTPLLIPERLGHESVQTTLNIYSHLYPGKQQELCEALERLQSEEKS